MNMPGPQLHSGNLWATREARCLSIVERALQLLRHVEDLGTPEVDLNRQLYFCLLRASRELFPDSEVAPVTECNNQPDPDDDARVKREHKRPDFQWIYLDRYESQPERSSKQFVVECKRLGMSSRTDWILNVNYANHGIERFRDPKWAYGQRFPSGAMVGYWQSMDPKQVLDEVNDESGRNSLPHLALIGAWNPANVTRLEHILDRTFEVSPFRLYHLWIDLRSAGNESDEDSDVG